MGELHARVTVMVLDSGFHPDYKTRILRLHTRVVSSVCGQVIVRNLDHAVGIVGFVKRLM